MIYRDNYNEYIYRVVFKENLSEFLTQEQINKLVSITTIVQEVMINKPIDIPKLTEEVHKKITAAKQFNIGNDYQ